MLRVDLTQEFHGHFVIDIDILQCFAKFLECNRQVTIGVLE